MLLGIRVGGVVSSFRSCVEEWRGANIRPLNPTAGSLLLLLPPFRLVPRLDWKKKTENSAAGGGGEEETKVEKSLEFSPSLRSLLSYAVESYFFAAYSLVQKKVNIMKNSAVFDKLQPKLMLRAWRFFSVLL